MRINRALRVNLIAKERAQETDVGTGEETQGRLEGFPPLFSESPVPTLC